MGSYDALRAAIAQIPWVDAHSHVLHHAVLEAAPQGPYPVLPLTRLLMEFNVRLGFFNAGMPATLPGQLLSGSISPEDQKMHILAYPGVHSFLPYQHLMRGLRELYRLDIWQITQENWDECDTAISSRPESFYDRLDAVCKNANHSYSVLNLWADKGRCYLTDYRNALSPSDLQRDNRSFAFCATFDYHAILPFAPLTQAYADDFGLSLNTLEDYTRLLERTAHWFVEEKGVKGFKFTEMYFRRLDYRIRSFEEAAPCYKKERTAEEDRILNDYVACTIFRLAETLHVPVQIHTGHLWGEYAYENVNPGYLSTAIAAFPQVKFDLLHGGDPFFDASILLASSYPNVYLNLSGMPLNSSSGTAVWLGEFLDRVPSTKLSLGWDVFTPETVCGLSHFTRDLLARVLAQKVDSGIYSLETALEVAHNLMHRTAEALFPRR